MEASQLDLLDPKSIDDFVTRYLATGRPLHILINNAGIMAGPLHRDARGYESQFATNHLGHFQLTLGLLPALQAAHGARVVKADDDEVMADLVAVKGIGAWSAHMFLMFQLDRPDVLAVGDLGIRRAVERAYGLDALPTPAEPGASKLPLKAETKKL